MNNKKLLIAISSGITFLDIFYNLFFNIYILDNVTSDLILIFSFNIIALIIGLLLYYPFFMLLKQSTVMWIYRFSFILSFLITLLTIFINSQFAFVLIILNTLRLLYFMCFYIPHEIGEMCITKSNETGKFLAWETIFNTLVSLIFTLAISSLYSYCPTYILFSIMLVVIVVMFVISFKLTPMEIPNTKLNLKKYFENCKKLPYMKTIYTCHFFKRMSQAGLISVIVPIIIYLKTGQSMSVGILSVIASIATISILPLFARMKSKKSITLIVSSICLILSTILLIITTNLVTFSIFYCFRQLTDSLFSNDQISVLFDSIDNEYLCNNQREHCFMYGTIGCLSEIISFIIGIILYICLPNEVSLTILLCLFMIIKLLSILFLMKAKKQRDYQN